MSTKKNRIYTEEFKRDAVSLMQREGYTLRETATRLGIHESVIGRWKQRIEKEGTPLNESIDAVSKDQREEIKRLRAENRRLQMERDILKKAAAFFAKENG